MNTFAVHNLADTFREAQGYAWGHEDASHIKTVNAPDAARDDFLGWRDFALAYVKAYAEWRTQYRTNMTNLRDAYACWQETGGKTIFRMGADILKADVEPVHGFSASTREHDKLCTLCSKPLAHPIHL